APADSRRHSELYRRLVDGQGVTDVQALKLFGELDRSTRPEGGTGKGPIANATGVCTFDEVPLPGWCVGLLSLGTRHKVSFAISPSLSEGTIPAANVSPVDVSKMFSIVKLQDILPRSVKMVSCS